MTQQDEFEELLGAYALDACDPAEAEAIDQHLRQCPRCRAELAAHLEVAGTLGNVGNLGGPAPEGLWDRVWGEISSLEHPETTSSPGEVAGSSPAPGPPPAPFTMPAPFTAIEGVALSPGREEPENRADAGIRSIGAPRPGRPRRSRSAALVAGAAAAVLAVAVGVLAATVVNLDHQVSVLNEAVISGGARGAEQVALADPRHRTAQLTSSTGEWRAKLTFLPSGEAFLAPEKMPPISASRTFQAWAVVRGGAVVSLGILGRSPEISQLLVPRGALAVLVNAEPLGGTRRPTTPVLLQASLATA